MVIYNHISRDDETVCPNRVINYSDYDARGTEILQIGYEKNKDIGLMQIKDNQTPTDNQQQSTIKRTQKKIAHAQTI